MAKICYLKTRQVRHLLVKMELFMKIISTRAFFIFITCNIIAPLCAMQSAATQQVIVRVSNMMKNQRAVVTFDTNELTSRSSRSKP